MADYTVDGSGPPLVLVPGLAGGTRLLQPLADVLAQDFQVFSYELRGEEDTFAVRRGFDVDDLATDLSELLDALGLESPLIMGVSFGGAVALSFASRFRGRLSGLIVQGADVRFEPTLLRQVAGRVLAGYPLPPDNAFVNQFFKVLFGSRHSDPEAFEFVTRQCWQTDQSVMAHRFRLAEQLDLGGRLAGIRVPTLLIRGKQDVLVSTAGWNELSRGIPLVKAIELRGAGHLACVTHAEEIAQQVQRFATKGRVLVDY
jgi:pimeloyl-ACP methyl ester carboxylesterase